ncbi:hypothetical protein A0257_14870 [Hymenobacter psoromatis]|nr:hypothetical protein A0257_14870 [Hymenobacter psoromatis]
MNQRPTVVHLPTPCPASWEAMMPTSAGRHCAQCQTEVVDFTQQSPAEILAYLHQANGRAICGRLRTAQLAPALPPAAARPRWRGWLSALLTASSLSALLLPKAAARVPVASATTHAKLPGSLDKLRFQTAAGSAGPLAKRPAADSIRIRGVAVDTETHQPVPYVMVTIKGTQLGAFSDKDGKFELTVLPNGQRLELIAVYVGYETVIKIIGGKRKSEKVKFLLRPSHTTLGRIIVPAKPYGGFFPKLRALRWFG